MDAQGGAVHCAVWQARGGGGGTLHDGHRRLRASAVLRVWLAHPPAHAGRLRTAPCSSWRSVRRCAGCVQRVEHFLAVRAYMYACMEQPVIRLPHLPRALLGVWSEELVHPRDHLPLRHSSGTEPCVMRHACAPCMCAMQAGERPVDKACKEEVKALLR